ncbi:hypothetical protein EFA46_004695 [Halarchaeum sp. CBA1220]|uniref:DUF5810 domain-containing protein n=1 Tax=Halarchaeum sp. CBA1220 TaxID=1853682 RepID=UPI000F3A920C|nr:DUF5810 domain-containing protein [Halarchaeum sp. CBA1220]QLC33525.1 hypothetical protein EFA46_004695 [Halarchaeum sp. CBA1220]
MGYACPVCDEHVPDAEHLADHLAFAAVTGASDHEAWLDEHAAGWEEGGTDDLAPRVTEHAETVEFEVETEPVEGHAHDHGHGSNGPAVDTSGAGALGGEAQRILEEAAEMTREMTGDSTESPNERAADDGDAVEDAEGETE